MSFFGKSSRQSRRKKDEFKAMFERKFCLAKSDPEPTFDLSGCGLETVPSAVFKFVAVLRKSALFLQNNELTSFGSKGNMKDLELLETLILSTNKLTIVPSDIILLQYLKILDLSRNQLASLPDSICELKSLEDMNLSSNKLSKLPVNIGRLTKLSRLDVSNNAELKTLPSSLHHATVLVEINWSQNQDFTFPPQDIMRQGPARILSFLAQECDSGCDINSNENLHLKNSSKNVPSPVLLQHEEMEAKLKLQEQLRTERAKEKVAFEEALMKQKQSELECLLSEKEKRKKMLREITKEQVELEIRMKNLQLQKETERSDLLLCLKEAERLTSAVITELLERNSQMRSSEYRLRLEEEDRALQEKLLKTHFEKSQLYRKEAIYEAMYNCLVSERKLEKQFCDHRAAMTELQTRSMKSEERMNENLEELMKNRSSECKELIKSIEQNEDLQRSAVSALLEQSDVQSFRLMHEIQSVEKQLAQATQLELEERRLTVLGNIVELCKERAALSQLLEELLKQRDERRLQLLSTINILQSQHLNKNLANDPDYWLQQYQTLLRLLPGNLQKAQQMLDARLIHQLVLANAIHCLPFVAHCANSMVIREISDQDLINSGVVLGSDRAKVLEAIGNFLLEIESPVVPVLDESIETNNTPSAPPMNECIICFEREISVVFMECGHCCCCDTCTVPLSCCPLCRAAIHRKIKLHLS
ncbi:unnamed protein product [Bemisia tabaci]|uniref:RING-type domain-containing protein n=1 Tax=Bemisia tabaci TaxID=7038 RepID=A0A9P0A4J2_BEMTA|nr:unnamed protein product [Bemisia tabaci]